MEALLKERVILSWTELIRSGIVSDRSIIEENGYFVSDRILCKEDCCFLFLLANSTTKSRLQIPLAIPACNSRLHITNCYSWISAWWYASGIVASYSRF
jgi:hypothetical protein